MRKVFGMSQNNRDDEKEIKQRQKGRLIKCAIEKER